jgi:hypothetical protein
VLTTWKAALFKLTGVQLKPSVALSDDCDFEHSHSRSFLVEELLNHEIFSVSEVCTSAHCQYLRAPSHMTAAASVQRNTNIAHHDRFPTYLAGESSESASFRASGMSCGPGRRNCGS